MFYTVFERANYSKKMVAIIIKVTVFMSLGLEGITLSPSQSHSTQECTSSHSYFLSSIYFAPTFTVVWPWPCSKGDFDNDSPFTFTIILQLVNYDTDQNLLHHCTQSHFLQCQAGKIETERKAQT